MSEHLDACSFCSKHKDSVAKLIVSEKVAICNECVDLCKDLLVDAPPDVSKKDILDPRSLKQFLDQYVIGQQQAKIMMSVAVINHYKRLNNRDSTIELEKANLLLLGPTGSGKTMLARTVAKFLSVPFVIADATSITEAGYVGDDVEVLISRLYAAADHDVERCQRGIVFIDEIDKISRKSESTSITRDVSGEGVQQALLKLIEGTVCRVPTQPGRKHPNTDMVEIDTTNILFIAGGAFVGLDTIINQRLSSSSMGFCGTVNNQQCANLDQTEPDDLVRFGMIPEFVGRFPNRVSLQPLDQHNLMQILTDVKNNLLDQYRWLFRQDGIELEFDRDALQTLVQKAHACNTGARALQSELEKVLMPHMFAMREYVELGMKTVQIDQSQVNTPTQIKEQNAILR